MPYAGSQTAPLRQQALVLGNVMAHVLGHSDGVFLAHLEHFDHHRRFAVEAGALALSSPAGTARIRDDGNGRLSVSGPPGDLRVLWADADDRTLVLARPDGGYAVVLNRTPTIAPDRLRAAREILAWNGVTP